MPCPFNDAERISVSQWIAFPQWRAAETAARPRWRDQRIRISPKITEPTLASCALLIPHRMRGLMRMNSTRNRAMSAEDEVLSG